MAIKSLNEAYEKNTITYICNACGDVFDPDNPDDVLNAHNDPKQVMSKCECDLYSQYYHMVVEIWPETNHVINRFLNADQPAQYQSEDETIVTTVKFPDGKEMDIKCCGCQDEASWTEAVLFDQNGAELCSSEPYGDYLGRWELTYEGNTYLAEVVLHDQSGCYSYA